MSYSRGYTYSTPQPSYSTTYPSSYTSPSSNYSSQPIYQSNYTASSYPQQQHYSTPSTSTNIRTSYPQYSTSTSPYNSSYSYTTNTSPQTYQSSTLSSSQYVPSYQTSSYQRTTQPINQYQQSNPTRQYSSSYSSQPYHAQTSVPYSTSSSVQPDYSNQNQRLNRVETPQQFSATSTRVPKTSHPSIPQTNVLNRAHDEVIDLDRDRVFDGVLKAQAQEEERLMEQLAPRLEQLMITAGPNQLQSLEKEVEDRCRLVAQPHLERVWTEFAKKYNGAALTKEEHSELCRCYITAHKKFSTKEREQSDIEAQQAMMAGMGMFPPELLAMIHGAASHMIKNIEDGIHSKLLQHSDQIALTVWTRLGGRDAISKDVFMNNFLKHFDEVVLEGMEKAAQNGQLDDLLPSAPMVMVMAMPIPTSGGPLMINGPSGMSGLTEYADFSTENIVPVQRGPVYLQHQNTSNHTQFYNSYY